MTKTYAKFAVAAAAGIFSLVVAAGPANALPPATVAFSSLTIAAGETVFFTTTNTFDAATPANSLTGCTYVDDLPYGAITVSNADGDTIVPFDVLFVASGPFADATSLTQVIFPAGTSSCPSPLSATTGSRLAFDTLTVIRSSGPSETAPEAETLPDTGANASVIGTSSAIAAGVLAAGAIALIAVRRRQTAQ